MSSTPLFVKPPLQMFALKAHHWGMDQPGQHAFRSLWLPLELRVRMMIMVVVVCPDRNFNDFFTGFFNWKNAVVQMKTSLWICWICFAFCSFFRVSSLFLASRGPLMMIYEWPVHALHHLTMFPKIPQNSGRNACNECGS